MAQARFGKCREGAPSSVHWQGGNSPLLFQVGVPPYSENEDSTTRYDINNPALTLHFNPLIEGGKDAHWFDASKQGKYIQGSRKKKNTEGRTPSLKKRWHEKFDGTPIENALDSALRFRGMPLTLGDGVCVLPPLPPIRVIDGAPVQGYVDAQTTEFVFGGVNGVETKSTYHPGAPLWWDYSTKKKKGIPLKEALENTVVDFFCDPSGLGQGALQGAVMKDLKVAKTLWDAEFVRNDDDTSLAFDLERFTKESNEGGDGGGGGSESERIVDDNAISSIFVSALDGTENREKVKEFYLHVSSSKTDGMLDKEDKKKAIACLLLNLEPYKSSVNRRENKYGVLDDGDTSTAACFARNKEKFAIGGDSVMGSIKEQMREEAKQAEETTDEDKIIFSTDFTSKQAELALPGTKRKKGDSNPPGAKLQTLQGVIQVINRLWKNAQAPKEGGNGKSSSASSSSSSSSSSSGSCESESLKALRKQLDTVERERDAARLEAEDAKLQLTTVSSATVMLCAQTLVAGAATAGVIAQVTDNDANTFRDTMTDDLGDALSATEFPLSWDMLTAGGKISSLEIAHTQSGNSAQVKRAKQRAGDLLEEIGDLVDEAGSAYDVRKGSNERLSEYEARVRAAMLEENVVKIFERSACVAEEDRFYRKADAVAGFAGLAFGGYSEAFTANEGVAHAIAAARQGFVVSGYIGASTQSTKALQGAVDVISGAAEYPVGSEEALGSISMTEAFVGAASMAPANHTKEEKKSRAYLGKVLRPSAHKLVDILADKELWGDTGVIVFSGDAETSDDDDDDDDDDDTAPGENAAKEAPNGPNKSKKKKQRRT
jgi:hypothetical protein